MKHTRWLVIVAVAVLAAAAPAAELPEAVTKAVAKAFPNATIRSVEQESEGAVRYYDLSLDMAGRRIEVEVDKDGNIGEVERVISLAEAPAALRKAVMEATGGTGKARIERHERWGVGRGDRFVPLQTPRVFYEIKLTVKGERRTSKWQPEPVALPPKAKAAVEALFPNCAITGVEAEDEDGVMLYEVTLVVNGLDAEVSLAADGTVAEVEWVVPTQALPTAVIEAIKKLAKDASVIRIEKEEIRAEAKDGKLVPLAKPRIVYEASLKKKDLFAEVEIAADGRVIEQPKWKKLGADDDDDDD